MSEETTNQATENNVNVNAAWDSPMLSRNAGKEGVPPTEQEQEAVEETPAVKLPEPTPQNTKDGEDKQSELQSKARAINILDSINEDPQFKPIAMYLDQQFAGIDTERAFGKALEYGDTNLIDKAYLTEKLGERASELINLSTSLFEAVSAKAEAQVNSIQQEFGGAAVVNQAIKFFNEKGDATERKVLASLLDSGVKENIKYAMERIISFSKQAGGVVSKNSVLPIGQPSGQKGLSADEYREAIRNLTSSKARPSDAEFEKLANARRLGIQQGL